MKTKLFLLVCLFATWEVVGQIAIHDRAVVAQRERMVFKAWDEERFYPKPNRIVGIPSNPLWYLTWALHPNYPKLDRRPLSPRGEQTQRLALAAAMKITADHYRKESDSVRFVAAREAARNSGALSSADPLYQMYYRKELMPLESFGDDVFNDVPVDVQAFLEEAGVAGRYREKMEGLAERYGLAKKLDMERGQRILMYHRILHEMRRSMESWDNEIRLSKKVLELKRFNGLEYRDGKRLKKWKSPDDSTMVYGILRNRKVLK